MPFPEAPSLLLTLGTLGVGLLLLLWSADRFVAGAAATARSLGVSPLMIGLTIVSFGTSAPEILVSLAAAREGTPLLAVGNALGSNITNIGLVLGVTALLVPLPVPKAIVRKEGPWFFGSALLALAVFWDGALSSLESLVLLAVLAAFAVALLRRPETGGAGDDGDLPTYGRGVALLWLLLGLALLLLAADLLVWSASTLARAMGVSELVIGLTVVAIGTSLPELAATAGAALKGHTDIAVGNVLGSNILNILAVMAVPGLFGTFALTPEVLYRDGLTMLGLSALLLGAAVFGGGRLGRPVGALFLVLWVAYTGLLALESTG
ncbi:MAG: calcium/sodium antiporter [Pseudomonadales bacterium]|jgi:cation:H+ antiporter|nr:calcium/sodium antiporter [Pseudomonadales bacterium]MBL6807888.1 calcium/sodium antiporter [Pseudomonadales bacterium]